MSLTELERRVTAVLHDHAEEAMNSTNTDERLVELLDSTRSDERRHGYYRLVAAVAATAAVTALAFWAATRDDERAAPQPAVPITPEQVATEYLQALAAYDLPRAESFFSRDVQLRLWDSKPTDLAGWRAAQAWDEAVSFQMDPGTCEPQGATAQGSIRYRCPYVFEGLGSKELGLGPYDDSAYVITVEDGAVVAATDDFAYNSNGYSSEVWEPFTAWVSQHYPQDVEAMYASPGVQATTDASIALWHQHLIQYLAAKLDQG